LINLTEKSGEIETNNKDLKDFIEKKAVKNAKRLKGKHFPISEIVDAVPKCLRVKNIYRVEQQFKDIFLIVVKNHHKLPKIRYFLAVQLASQSSDLLARLARNCAVKNDLKLIQYPIYPKTLRINLLALKELDSVQNFSKWIALLENFKNLFNQKLKKLNELLESQ